MPIRPVRHCDYTAILEFWNPIIRNTDVTFNSVEKTRASLSDELDEKAAQDRPFLVAEDGGEILGFATYGQFRGSNGYARTMENTIVLPPKAHGKGLGRQLMVAIENHARRRHIHSMIAGVSHRNPDGIAFHAAVGYVEVARLPDVGYKFGQWYDLILMQKIL